MRTLGRVVRVQVQPESLKIGVAPGRRYDPTGPAVSDAVRFLHNGMRGYYATYRGASRRIRLGARVMVPGSEKDAI